LTSAAENINNPIMDDLLKNLTEIGLKTADKKPAEAEIIKASPHYRGNPGFFHFSAENWEAVTLKGVYKDNIRMMRGSDNIDKKTLNSLSQMCADAERNQRKPLTMELFVDQGTVFLYHAEHTPAQPEKTDSRDFYIKSPVTPVEKSLAKTDTANYKHLFNKNAFSEIFPETLSPLAMSLASAMPDVMNPLFMSSSIKTHSPSLKLVFGRLYLNISNAETIISAFYQKPDFFLMNFCPNIFKKIKKPSFGIPNDRDIKITDEEILETIKDIKETTDSAAPDDIFTDEFLELTALCFMAWEMVYIRLWKSFTDFHKFLGKSMDEAVVHIYKTRKDSILQKPFHSICEIFDPSVVPVSIEGLNLDRTDADEMYKKIPAAKRITLSKSKYMSKLENAHRYLEMRDSLYTSAAMLTEKMRTVLCGIGDDLVKNSVLTSSDDIFYFELKEIYKILHDEYFGNIPFTISFRKWQNARFSALCLPHSLYEKDVETADTISARQIEHSLKEKTVPVFSFFHKDMTTDRFSALPSHSLSSLYGLEDCGCVISESASIFSFAAEYCAVMDKPLYTGGRFASLILKGKNITTGKESISFE